MNSSINTTIKLLILGTFCAVLGSACTILIQRYFVKPQVIVIEEDNNKSRMTSFSNKDIAPTSQFSTIIEESKSTVVAISAIKRKNASNSAYSVEIGSGVLFSPEGYIVTNYHVIKEATTIDIKLTDKREFTAKVYGFDTATDLAILKIDGTNFPHIILGNSDSLRIGEWILAIGNPYKLQSSVTAGIVSAKSRDINILDQSSGIESFIQTDAAINHGNSGGALIDTQGKLVGINTAIISESGNYEGFSFAIPVNLVKKVIYDLIEYGTVQRGWLGISLSDVDEQVAIKNNLPDINGVLIDLVQDNSAADAADIRKGDIITAVENQTTNSSSEFMERMALYNPGQSLELTIYRDGQKKIKNVVLRNYLNNTDIVEMSHDASLKEIGIELRNLTEDEQHISSGGVKVISIQKGSKIQETNMKPGFIITSINENKVESITDFVTYLKSEKGVILLEGIYEDYPGHFPYQFIK